MLDQWIVQRTDAIVDPGWIRLVAVVVPGSWNDDILTTALFVLAMAHIVSSTKGLMLTHPHAMPMDTHINLQSLNSRASLCASHLQNALNNVQQSCWFRRLKRLP